MNNIPGYEVTQLLGEGVHAVLRRGIRRSDGRPVLLKGPGNAHDPRERSRLRHEYQLVRELDVAGVLRPLALEESPDDFALVLEDPGFVPLSVLLREGGLGLATSLRLALSLAQTLGALHRAGIIHKDVKPGSILVDPGTGRTKLTDFGSATRLSQETRRPGSPQQLEGTLAYLSPEQTGRMNRTIDYRADFYALGVTLYEVLVGRLPFQTTDAMELVHSHIARRPAPPHEVRPAIPRAVSDIVMKLLAKAAEDRYQSAAGLQADLAGCLTQLEATGRIEPFAPGRADVSDRFHIPQKLYGRHKELETLLSTFERVCRGRTEMMLVAGYSGIGKSSLIHELHKPIVAHRGYFISGKFDQYRRNIPYASLLQAFQELIRQLLTEGEDRVASWRRRLREALEPNGQVITDVIPDLELLLGKQPPVPALDPVASQNRFNLVFQSFIHVFTREEHPLVLFLDDLQWQDPASLKLLSLLVTEPESRHLFLIGAYRDNEVGPNHPLLLTLAEMEQAGAAIHHLELGALSQESVEALIADTLGCDRERAGPLAELVLERTAGNPFFVNQFLKELHQKQLLRFDAVHGRWTWEPEQLREQGITENVVELLTRKLRQLSPKAQRACTLAACIGNRFDLATLAIVSQQPPAAAAADLWEVVQEDLVTPSGDSYRLLAELEAAGGSGAPAPGAISYVFRHDRIQQVAGALVSEGERRELHLRIGRLLLGDTPASALEERLFDIVDHFDAGLEGVTEPAERARLAELYLLAGRKAKASMAPEAADRWLSTGISLLSDDCWSGQYELAHRLYLGSAECAHLTGNPGRMEELLATLQRHVRTDLERAGILKMKTSVYYRQSRFLDSLAVARQALRLLGVDFPESEEAAGPVLAEELATARRNLGDREIESLGALPELTDPALLMAVHVLVELWENCYVGSLTTLSSVGVMKLVNLSLRHGNSAASSFAYVMYGFMLGAFDRDFRAAEEYGRLALRIGERYEDPTLLTRARHLYAIFINAWRNDMRAAIPIHRDVMKVGQAIGDLVNAAYTSLHPPCLGLMVGAPLEPLAAEFREAVAFQQRTGKIQHIIDYTRIRQQLCQALLGLTRDPVSLSDDTFDEAAALARWQASGWSNGVNWYFITKAQLHYLHGRYAEALACAQEAERTIGASLMLVLTAEHNFFYSLVLLANLPAGGEARAELLARVKANQEALGRWADNCPQNFWDRFLLVSAEEARCTGRYEEAMDLYDRAIEAARASHFLQQEALGNELAARFHLARGRQRVARAYLAEAHECYARWGAVAKVRQLAEAHPGPLPGAAAAPAPLEAPPPEARPTAAGRGDLLDMMTVVKAAQAISGEIVLDALLTKLMRIVLENAGAHKGVLILERDSRQVIEAMVTVDPDAVEVRPGLPIESSGDLCVPIVQYVGRTREPVVLHDASREGRFIGDPYVLAHRARSILCLPLVHQGHLTGCLYLENNRAADVFTPGRIELLQLLSSQAAIAIENALLYARVQQRTGELARAVAEAQEARAAAERANELKSQFLASVSHELRTPLNAIINFTLIVSSGRKGPVTEAQVDFLNRVIQSGEHLLGLINDILDLSKIEAGRMELVKEPLQLAELVPSVMETVATLKKGKPIVLRQELAPDLPLVEADPTRLRQILLNLLSNAVKFTREGEISVRVRRQGGELVVEVRDTGIGIAAEHLGTIFEAFRQVEGGRSRRYEGTGLGLTICKSLIELHGGRIWVESTPGVGSTFFFSLPALASAQSPVDPSPARLFTPREAGERRILVIDDEQSNIEIVAAYLEHDGYAVYGLTDSRRAVEEARRLVPTAVILDVLMPHKDGWAVLAELKADPALARVPVALYTILEKRESGFYLGANAWLLKPVNEAQLRATVGELVTRGATVLAIDDDPDTLEIIQHQLEQAGPYRVETAGGGQAGLDRIARARPDLIILDLMMPEVDGFTVLERLDRDPRTRAIPVIVLTARELTRQEQELLRQRVGALLAKGHTRPEQLLAKVSELLTPSKRNQ